MAEGPEQRRHQTQPVSSPGHGQQNPCAAAWNKPSAQQGPAGWQRSWHKYSCSSTFPISCTTAAPSPRPSREQEWFCPHPRLSRFCHPWHAALGTGCQSRTKRSAVTGRLREPRGRSGERGHGTGTRLPTAGAGSTAPSGALTLLRAGTGGTGRHSPPRGPGKRGGHNRVPQGTSGCRRSPGGSRALQPLQSVQGRKGSAELFRDNFLFR